MIAWSVLPLCLGFVSAGVLAFTHGLEIALIALGVGAACTATLAGVLCTIGVIIALTALFRVAESLWFAVMLPRPEVCLCCGGDRGGGGGGGDDLEEDAATSGVVWDSGRPVPSSFPRIFPTLN